MGAERPEELYLKRLVEILHGAELDHYDRDGRQGAVDYVFATPTGPGAVEVTTVRDSGAEAWFTRLNDPASYVIRCESSRSWALTVALSSRLSDLKARVPLVVELLDRHSLDNPLRLPPEAQTDDIRWFVSTSNKLRPIDHGEPGAVYVWLPTQAGFADLTGIDQDLADMLGTKQAHGKAQKLQAHPGAVERHLAIGVNLLAPYFYLVNALKFDGERPPPPRQDLPHALSLTHVWVTGGGHNILAWDVDQHWHWRRLPRHAPDDGAVRPQAGGS